MIWVNCIAFLTERETWTSSICYVIGTQSLESHNSTFANLRYFCVFCSFSCLNFTTVRDNFLNKLWEYTFDRYIKNTPFLQPMLSYSWDYSSSNKITIKSWTHNCNPFWMNVDFKNISSFQRDKHKHMVHHTTQMCSCCKQLPCLIWR